jgi:hypothetical protein
MTPTGYLDYTHKERGQGLNKLVGYIKRGR